MAQTIRRKDIQKVLIGWQKGKLTAKEVHAWAEDRYAAYNWDPEDDVVNEVLGRLDLLNMTLTTPEDIPAFLQTLSYSSDCLQQAVEYLEGYESEVDIEQRKRACAHDPLYAPFCGQA
ncbi:MAG: hypothetical protein HY282_18195 [Nitrospirae bacterium]|nr:hypothetical protein [Candidatus Manganitrophaceae bacterium]